MEEGKAKENFKRLPIICSKHWKIRNWIPYSDRKEAVVR